MFWKRASLANFLIWFPVFEMGWSVGIGPGPAVLV